MVHGKFHISILWEEDEIAPIQAYERDSRVEVLWYSCAILYSYIQKRDQATPCRGSEAIGPQSIVFYASTCPCRVGRWTGTCVCWVVVDNRREGIGRQRAGQSRVNTLSSVLQLFLPYTRTRVRPALPNLHCHWCTFSPSFNLIVFEAPIELEWLRRLS